MNKYVVSGVDDFPADGCKLVHVKGRPIAIFKLQDEFFALSNRCPHQGGSLCHGKRIGLVDAHQPGEYNYSRPGEIIRCPWHGWEFDIRTGLSKVRPSDVVVRKFQVDVEEGETIAAVPNIKGIETFSIKVDGNYLVLTM